MTCTQGHLLSLQQKEHIFLYTVIAGSDQSSHNNINIYSFFIWKYLKKKQQTKVNILLLAVCVATCNTEEYSVSECNFESLFTNTSLSI